MLRVFFDTEFTQFDAPELLSIGLISEDGESQCYLELLDAKRERRASEFVRDNVIPLFGRVQGAQVASLKELGRRLAAFLDAKNERIELCYDYKHDWTLFEGALVAAGRWEDLASRLLARDIAGEVASEEAQQAADAEFDADPEMRHHGLTDAKALRAKWLARPALDTSDFGRVRTYLGYGGMDDRGNTLVSTLWRDNDWFEDHRYFIQWMFPIAERSQVKQDGPMLTPAEFQRLADDEHVRDGVMRGTVRLLSFLGLRLDADADAAVEGDNWVTASHRWARFSGHNDMRISRMLRCLALTGQGELARGLYVSLESLVRRTRSSQVAEPALAYWRAAAYR